MKLLLKNAILCTLLCLMTITACKKDNKPDFRDSVVGNYNCIKHYSYTTVTSDSLHLHTIWGRADTTLGPVVITVTKSSTDSSIIMVNNSYYLISSNKLQYNYFKYGLQGTPDSAHFFVSNDSIWFQNTLDKGVSHWDYNYYTGRKQ